MAESRPFASPSPGLPATKRVFFLDSARALFMLLGIPFHAALVFGTLGPWLIHDSASSEALTVFSAILHIFRMPGFFFIAGFFAALLIARRGAGAWLSDRAVRLGVPLITALLLLNPVQLWVEATVRMRGTDAIEGMGAVLAQNPDRLLLHLWFLPALLMQCVVLALMWRFSSPFLPWARDRLVPLAERGFALPLAAGAILLWMLAAEEASLLFGDVAGGYLQTLFDAIDFLPWFLIGVAAQRVPALLTKLTRFGPMAMLFVVIAAPIHVAAFLFPDLPHAYFWQSVSEPVAALGLVICILALLRRHADGHNRFISAIVTASFTIYLFHQPVILLSEYALMGLALPPIAKWALIVAVTLPVCFLIHRLIASVPLLLFLFNGVHSRRTRTLLRPAAG